MKWIYYIPHEWDSPDDRQVWEDVYLLPDAAPEGTKSLWLTIDALGDVTNPEHGSDRAEFQSAALEKLGDADWHIDEADMIVRATDFDFPELLDWIKVWLHENDFECLELQPGPRERFAGSNNHISTIDELASGEPNVDD